MKISRFRQIQMIVLIGIFCCAFTPCFSQVPVKDIKGVEKIQEKINSKKVDSAYAKRKPFWMVGGFLGLFYLGIDFI